MKKLIIIYLFFNIQFINAVNPPILSECYSYHTPHYYDVFTENNKIIFKHTIKDPNGISYVYQKKITLNSIRSTAFKIIAEDASKILFSTIDGYYIAEKDENEIEKHGVSKLGNYNEISETVGTNFMCKNGLWYFTQPKNYSTEIIEKKIKSMPKNLEHYLDNALREGSIYKNNEAVYIFNYDKLAFRKIPNLTGKQLRHRKVSSYLKQYFLYDNDTFYFLNFNDMVDYSEQFTSRSEFTSFKNAEIIQHKFGNSINTNDGFIWLYLKFYITNDNGKRINIVPVKATYLGKEKELLYHHSKIYDDFSDLLNKRNSIDVSLIKDIKNLTKDPYYNGSGQFYNDGKSRYIFDYENNIFKPIDWLPANTKYYPNNGTYGYLGTNTFYADNKYIYFIKKIEKKSKTLKHSSPLKNLTLAYAYDDKLLIENKEIKNIADRESIAFIGSTVKVISGCDGGRGQYPVEIDVYYFFKDKNGIYVYNTKKPKMRKIVNEKLSNIKVDNYEYLIQLMKQA